MQTVYILRHNRSKLTLAFKLCKFEVRRIRFSVRAQHFCAVESIKFLRLFHEKAVAENSLGRIIPLLIVKTVNTSEIRNTALGGNSCTAEKDYLIGIFDHSAKFFDLFHTTHP